MAANTSKAQGVVLTPYQSQAVLDCLSDVAHLRVTVFREFPYLYDGDMDAETEYLQYLAKSEHALVITANDNGAIVGVATGMPLRSAHAEFQSPFETTEKAIESIYYLGEFVLLPEYRNHGIGSRFLSQMETFALQNGYRDITFCAVDRPKTHPLQPADYLSPEQLHAKWGYSSTGLQAHLSWRQWDTTSETQNTLSFWIKSFTQ